MRAIHWLCCMAVLGVCLTSSAPAQQGVRWQPTLESARRTAGQTGRLVLIHFWGEGCRPCEMMERNVYSRPDVAAAIDRDFVAVKINRAHFPESASQYGVSGVPADVIITPQGQLLQRNTGAVPASEYVNRLGQIASNWRASSPAAGYAQNPSRPPQSSPAMSLANRPGYDAPQPTVGARPAGPPAMDRRYPGRPDATVEQNRQLAASRPGPPAYRREAPQPVESRYSPPLAHNAASSLRPDPAQAGDPRQQPPYPGPNTPRSDNVGGFAQNRVQAPSERQPSSYQSDRQPSQVEESSVNSPAGNPSAALGEFALDGYCPVQLMEKNRWVVGNRRWGLRHEGRTYLFAGPDEKQRFDERPSDYAPVLSGNDVVLLVDGGRQTEGRREHGAKFNGRVYLFANETSFEKFATDPERYAGAIEESVSNVANRNAAPPFSARPWNSRN